MAYQDDKEIEEIASSIADHKHKNQYHWEKPDENWKELGVHSKEHYKEYVKKTLTDENTVGFKTENGRQIYYNYSSNVFIVINKNQLDKSTAYRPKEKSGDIDRALQTEADRKNQPYLSVTRGGYEKVNNSKEQVNKKDNKISSTRSERVSDEINKLRAKIQEQDRKGLSYNRDREEFDHER